MNADLQERLKNLSPAERARILKALREEAARQGKPDAIPKRPRQDSARLSFAQQRLWFIHQLAPEITAYNFLLAVRLEGDLDVAALERALNRVVSRHESLRTTFSLSEGGEPRQHVAAGLRLALPVIDLRGEPERVRREAARRLIMEVADEPFDLSRGPLLRARLLRLGAGEHAAALALHHAVADGWSLGVLMRELGHYYGRYSGGGGGVGEELGELVVQYGDYAEWQRGRLRGEALAAEVGYWRGRLEGMATLEVPTDRARPAAQSFRGATHTFDLSPELTAALRALNKREGVTMFMTLLAALQTLCYRYTGQEDVVVSTGTSNRNHPDTEALIGCFINILLMRSDLSGNPSFLELLGRVRKVAVDAYAHQDFPFELLVEALGPERDLSYNPLSQVMLVLHNAPAEAMRLKDLVIEPIEGERNTAQLDLNLQIWERPDRLTGLLEYDTDLFERSTIIRMVGHFQNLLEAAVRNPAQRLRELPLLTEAERHQLLVELNETPAVFPAHLCLHQLFEAQAQTSPRALAVIAENSSLTYEELNRRADRLAHELRALGVGPGKGVAVCVERSPEMVQGLVGTLKAGGAIVPLDPAYPKERLAFMLEDAQVSVLLTQRHLADRIPRHGAETVYLDADGRDGEHDSAPNLNSGVTPGDLAYVIYTSGSTGLPKAVMLDHRGRVNNFSDFNRRFRVGAGDRLIALSSLSFDMSAYDVFGTLASGAAIVLPRASKERDPSHWADLMRRHKVTIWHSAPALLEMLLEQFGDRPESAPASLRLALLGGDWIPLTLPGRLKKLVAGVRVISLGGATEASMDSIIYPVEKSDPAWRSIPYGRPMANQTGYILDAHLQPVPIGVPGELYLGGVGLAWGYRNRPELSAEKFIPHPFGGEPGSRLYKTGDLARHMPDGNIELLGRLDQQVKLRGLRIELGEIVATLKQHHAVKEAVALVREDEAGNKHLVAYIVPGQEPLPAAGELRDFLKRTLPDYMVPSFFVALESLPLTPNGKVDRRSLPAPDTTRREAGGEFVAPGDAVEEVVAGVWAEVLHLERVSVGDNFFDLGGHSLLATQIVSRLQSSFSIELPLRHIFEAPTVSGLARRIEAVGSAAHVDVPAVAGILVKVSRLSDDEVRRMLAEKSGRHSET